MKKDYLAEKKILEKEKDFDRYIRERSEVFSDWYYNCFSIDIHYYVQSAVYPAIHLIDLMGYTTGAEIGVSHGQSTITLIEKCEKLKTLYCVDNYKPYQDYYTENFCVDKYEIAVIKNLALKKIYNSKNSNKVVFYEEDSDISVERFKNGELDFVLLDAHLNAEQIRNDLEKWYPKVRSGGLVMIHDTNFPTVLEEIKMFLDKIEFNGKSSNIIDLCCLLKP
jgi:hypothetical protein